MLFSDLTIAINTTSDLIAIPPNFDAPSNLMAYGSLAALSADFVAVACTSCGIVLNQTQLTDIRRLFGVVLPVFFVFSCECDLLTLAIVEQAILAADPNFLSAANIVGVIDAMVGVLSQLTSARHFFDVQRLLNDPPAAAADVTAAAQSILDGFLFTINDFCGIPPLSQASLALLDDAFLVELVNLASV